MANPNPDQSGLIPPKKGEVRNPLGINNKNKRFTEALVKLLDSDGLLDDKFVRAGLVKALTGKGNADFNFWRYIYERIEGKIPEPPEPEPEVTMEEVAKRLRERKNAKKRKKNE